MTIGERIKERRIELGMTQDELAKIVGYKSRSSINKIELSRDLPLKKVSLIAAALDTPPGYLMGWESIDGKIQRPITLDEMRHMGAEESRAEFNNMFHYVGYSIRRTHNGFCLETNEDEYGDYHDKVIISEEELDNLIKQTCDYMLFILSTLYRSKENNTRV